MKDSFIELSVTSYSEETMFGIFRSMSFEELLKEYSATLKAYYAYFSEGVFGCVGFEYLDGVVQIMRIVICERILQYYSMVCDGQI